MQATEKLQLQEVFQLLGKGTKVTECHWSKIKQVKNLAPPPQKKKKKKKNNNSNNSHSDIDIGTWTHPF